MKIDTLKTTKKVIGAKQTVKAVEKQQAQVVYVALNADSRIIEPVRKACIAKQIEIKECSTMDELGEICGIEVGAAAIAILKA